MRLQATPDEPEVTRVKVIEISRLLNGGSWQVSGLDHRTLFVPAALQIRCRGLGLKVELEPEPCPERDEGGTVDSGGAIQNENWPPESERAAQSAGHCQA